MWREDVSKGSGGFTLLELLTVIAIIAVLSGIAVGGGRYAIEASNIARAKAELAALTVALDGYQRAYGDYPRTNDAALLLQALGGRRDPMGTAVAGRPLIDPARFAVPGGADPFSDPTSRLVDPWGQPYRYAYKSQSPWTNSSYVLWSIGPDGAESAALVAGGYADALAPANLDNIYANQD